MKKLLVKNIGLLATPEGKSAHRGEEQGKIKFLRMRGCSSRTAS